MKNVKSFNKLFESTRDESIKSTEGKALNIGDVVERGGEQYQILFDGRPFLYPYPISGKIDKSKAIYFEESPEMADGLSKVKSYSETSGGFYVGESSGAQYRENLDRFLPLHDAPNPRNDAKKLVKLYSWEPDELLSICYNIMVEINEHQLAADFVEIVKKSYER